MLEWVNSLFTFSTLNFEILELRKKLSPNINWQFKFYIYEALCYTYSYNKKNIWLLKIFIQYKKSCPKCMS